MTDYLRVCELAALTGGQVLLDWVGRFASREKAPADLVTDADLSSQDEIRRIIQQNFPLHAFLGEEGAPSGREGSEYRWLVDPLDGTTNYVHRIPHFCVSVALEYQGNPICGTIFDPVARECFSGALTTGAFLNGRNLKVSTVKKLEEAVVAASFPPRLKSESRELKELAQMMVASQAVRRTGSAALNLSYVAAGRFDAYWGGLTKPWDIAAGVLLIREAGGIVTASDGGPLQMEGGRMVAAATVELHEQMLRLVGDEATLR
jgi:myo-inositol-1(or 4)-monophosphatase